MRRSILQHAVTGKLRPSAALAGENRHDEPVGSYA
jgi:hypothetical protein